ncbi:MAG: ABC transporter permease [Chloroflexota bacterium]
MAEQKPDEKPEEQKNAGEILLDELTSAPSGSRWRQLRQTILIPFLAVITGLIVSGIFIVLTTEDVYRAFGESIGAGFQTTFSTIWGAYAALFTGALGDPATISAALSSGDSEAIRRAFNPFLESLVVSTPFIFAGLAVSLGFQTGLFNIGAEGQLFMGATLATVVAYSFDGMPAIIHLPLALIAGFIGGGLWGMIPGWLKARTGAHEVINTIMMNFIAIQFLNWLLRGPIQDPDSSNPISPLILDSAKLPRFFEQPIRFHLGFFLSLVFAWIVWWFLYKTKWGFSLRMVGANPNAARYAGVNIVSATVIAMSLSGALAGLAGANEILGINHRLTASFSAGIGFDAIALALLGKNHPAGVVFAALLFGTLKNGAVRMQVAAGIPIDIIAVVQALVLAFIAAPAIVRTIYRLRETGDDEALVTSTWG